MWSIGKEPREQIEQQNGIKPMKDIQLEQRMSVDINNSGQKTMNKMVIVIIINNYFKYKWIKLSNQKMQNS